nr:MAG: ORF1 [Torque teno midi virus]
MPFWWKRRRRPWFGRYRYKRRKTYRRRKRRFPRRRRYRKTTRRRRRRKVRRKLKKIILKQWQPDSIVKCKIKGTDSELLGAQGVQHRCYTTYKYEWTIPKAPGGGGFSAELYTLKYLYQEWQHRNNIWTKNNDYRDLCRYTGCKFIFYADPKTDFIIAYDTQAPFTLDKYTYMQYHPQQLLHRKHKRILLSKKNNPRSKHKLKLKIRPPKQMSNKWFFQQHFADAGLVNIITAAANFNYPYLACCNENQIITIYFLNPTFYYNSNWTAFSTKYMPVNTTHKTLKFTYEVGGVDKTVIIDANDKTFDYNKSVSYENGWFQTGVMLAKKVEEVTNSTHIQFANIPCGAARYNVNLDNGSGNKIWLTSVANGHYNVPRDEDLIIENIPLWLALYGYTSFLWQKKHDKSYFKSYMLVVKSSAIQPLQNVTTPEYYPIIDKNFIYGKAPGDTYLDANMKLRWYPTLETQLETVNNFVLTGPYIPKYNNQSESTWQLSTSYTFYFKWGGPHQTDQVVADPTKQPTWNVPDKLIQGVQVSNPEKQKWETIFKPWDYRRGTLTKKAIKRMYDHLDSDESLFSDASQHSPKKKVRIPPLLRVPEQENKEIQDCLHSLFEESTSQETQTPQEANLHQLIQQQKHQQQQLKLNLFKLIQDLKTQQKALQYHTGLIT